MDKNEGEGREGGRKMEEEERGREEEADLRKISKGGRGTERKRERKMIRCQFHQHFTRGFFVLKFCTKLFCTYIFGLNFCWQKNIGANAHIKCW